MSRLQRKEFKAEELIKVGGRPKNHPHLKLGDKIVLNSGGPELLVVDIAPDFIVASWASGGKILELYGSEQMFTRVDLYKEQ